jgi:hypothetical protein
MLSESVGVYLVKASFYPGAWRAPRAVIGCYGAARSETEVTYG